MPKIQIKSGYKFSFDGDRYTVTRRFGTPDQKCWVAKSAHRERWFTEEEILSQ